MHDTIKQMAQMFSVTEHNLPGSGKAAAVRGDSGNRRVFDNPSTGCRASSA